MQQPGTVGTVHTKYVDLPEALRLDSGRTLAPVRIAYETYGTLSPAKDNVILVCHALSGDAHAAGWSDDPAAPTTVDGVGAADRGKRGLGWWDGMIGPGKAFDTDRYFVVCSNLIGSCRGSTGPASIDPATGRAYGATFPVITVPDMVRAERALLRELGIDRVLAVSGGSLGGMQALEWAVAFPDAVRAIVPIAATARLGTQGVAWNAIARNAITSDPNWQGGAYDGTGRAPDAGIKIARMVGHVTYLSAQAVREKFGRRFQRGGDEPLYDLTAADFEVESYLRYQADAFAARFDANAYLYISRALTYFDLARTYGQGSLERALDRVRAATLLLSFSSDWLYPPRDSEEIAAALRAAGKDVRHAIIQADYGHDSFLLEEAEMTREIAAFLDRVGEKVA
ncbi:MAG TPA: homoserine O-acetyltransferase [Candidatus Limnocylindria bacterium]|nr:homoserine O-acetyltransferase [Candidatus Limnocylindria bacterium]